MESAQRELASVLLDHIRSLGLISDFTYSEAANLIHSVMDFRDFFQRPVCLAAGETAIKAQQNAAGT